MKRIILFFIGALLSLTVYATEPGNNLGKSLYQLKQSFPGLSYIQKVEGGADQYGQYEDGVGTFFFLINNRVCGETMMVQGAGFAEDWYNALVEKFTEAYSGNITGKSWNKVDFSFSNFTIQIMIDRTQHMTSINYYIK